MAKCNTFKWLKQDRLSGQDGAPANMCL